MEVGKQGINYKDYLMSISNQITYFFEKPLTKKICFGLIIITSFFLIYILNILHPLFGDDWRYSFEPDGQTRIISFSQILKFEYDHYFTWGGRNVVHTIAQILLLAGIKIGDLVNSLAYVIFTLVIYFIANLTNPLRPSILLAANFLVWFLQPAFGSTILWITGSANYLWGTLIIISFLVPYCAHIFNIQHKYKKNFLYDSWMFIFGVIAGWTNENMAIALIFMVIIFLLYYKKKTGFIPKWAIVGLCGSIIGCIIMIAAPGNYVRMDLFLENSSSQSFLIIYFNQFINSLAGFYYYALPGTFIYLIILWLYLTYHKTSDRTPLLLSSIFMGGAILATLAMTGSPVFPGRASFGINTFIFIAICILFANLNFKKNLVRQLSATTMIFLFLFFTADYYRAYKVLNSASEKLEIRLKKIEEEKKTGKKHFILNDRIIPEGRFFHYYELTPHTTEWHNRTFSAYYEIESVIME